MFFFFFAVVACSVAYLRFKHYDGCMQVHISHFMAVITSPQVYMLLQFTFIQIKPEGARFFLIESEARQIEVVAILPF